MSIGSLEPTLFHETWWLEAAAGGLVETARVVRNGKIIAQLPYYKRKHGFGLTSIDLPPLTHFLGPTILVRDSSEKNAFLERLDITRALIEQLPEVSEIYIKCHRGVSDVIAFQSCGFRSAVQFTHEIGPQDIGAVWAGMRDKGRNAVRKAGALYTVDQDVAVAEFLAFFMNNLRIRGRKSEQHPDRLQQIIAAAKARGRGSVKGARDETGTLGAAIFCAWDEGSYYYIMSTRTMNSHRGAISLLIWEGICDAMRRQLIFDFDGIPDEGSARLAANFSTTITPRYVAIRETKLMRIIRAVNALFVRPRFFWR